MLPPAMVSYTPTPHGRVYNIVYSGPKLLLLSVVMFQSQPERALRLFILATRTRESAHTPTTTCARATFAALKLWLMYHPIPCLVPPLQAPSRATRHFFYSRDLWTQTTPALPFRLPVPALPTVAATLPAVFLPPTPHTTPIHGRWIDPCSHRTRFLLVCYSLILVGYSFEQPLRTVSSVLVPFLLTTYQFYTILPDA